MLKSGMFSIIAITMFMSASAYVHATEISAEDLLYWEFKSQNPGIEIVDGLPVPPEKPKNSAALTTTPQKNIIVVSGNAGPRMPAVPPGNVHIEPIHHHADIVKAPNTTPHQSALGLNTFSATPKRTPQSQEQPTKMVVPAAITSGTTPQNNKTTSDPSTLSTIRKSVVKEFRNIINTLETTTESVKENISPSSEKQPETMPSPPSLPPLPVSTDVPYLSFVFEEGEQAVLNQSQIFILQNEIQNLKNSQYKGQIKVFSYGGQDSFKNANMRETLTGRAGQIRNLLLEAGIDIRQLDVRTVPNQQKDNRVDVFLTGNS
mgnify:CR=1 FL=1|jgi:hypothetical protein